MADQCTTIQRTIIRRMTIRWTVMPALLAVAAMLAPVNVAATAADPPQTRRGGSAPGAPRCVSVEVDGYGAGSADCMAHRLEQAARTAQARARSTIEVPVIDATSPDVRTGVANQTATRQRMGNTFGTSVQPQRPYRAPPAPRPGGRP
ncbi:hypothetical protein [Novosphingobium gossypii]|uniref:hypothetical protein n=1 Tax=Novosphingobium gossypii TaxID=1604774 RepID=UPI003D1AC856